MWVARDKDGILWWFSSEPDRCSECWGISNPNDDMVCINSSLFPNLKWDDEPLEVKLVPETTVIVEMPSEEEIENAMKTSVAESILCVAPYESFTPKATDLLECAWLKGAEWVKSKIMK